MLLTHKKTTANTGGPRAELCKRATQTLVKATDSWASGVAPRALAALQLRGRQQLYDNGMLSVELEAALSMWVHCWRVSPATGCQHINCQWQQALHTTGLVKAGHLLSSR